jgi:hypothetical protein
MANPVWPITLPQYVLEQGYQENMPDNNIESSVDAGLPKARPRFTAPFQKMTFGVQMDAGQVATFTDFYKNVLATGSQPFDWVHPYTRQACTFRFTKPVPQATSQGGTYQVWTLNVMLISYND